METEADLIIFLRHQASDGLVFDAFDDVNCDTRIFLQQHIPNMLSIFQYNSIHYLLKPKFIVEDGLIRPENGNILQDYTVRFTGRRQCIQLPFPD